MSDFRFGILGCGKIAHKFTKAVMGTPGMTVSAAASRTLQKAQDFSALYGISHAYEGYDALLDSGEVDAVYVATPHPMHFELAKEALMRKIPVLCEKPMTVSLAETDVLIGLAEKQNTFLMEGMWSITLPLFYEAKRLIESGAIGELRRIDANFCFRSEIDPKSRLFAPELAGGSLLDIGIYPLAYAFAFCGKNPLQVSSSLYIGETGVDESSSVILTYPGGVTAHCTASMRTSLPVEARLYGTKGHIVIPDFIHPDRILLTKDGEPTKELVRPHPVNGYEFEAIEVMNAVRSGALQSPSVPWEATRAVMKLMDDIRKANGLRYPFE